MAKRLLLLNGAAILCVVLFHATGFGYTAMFAWAHRYRPVAAPNYDEVGSAAYYGLRLIEQLTVFSIPAFLFVSGFFVAFLTGRNRPTVALATVGARVKSLLIPYLIWSVVVLLGFALQGRVFSGTQYLRLLLTGASDPSYYYVPLLIQLYLLAPLIVLAARWKWKALLATAAAIQLLVYFLQYVVVLRLDIPVVRPLAVTLPKWLFLVQLFWFTSGVIVGLHQQSLKPALERVRWTLLPALVVLFVLGFVEWELLLRASGRPWVENRVTLIDGIYAGTLILTFLAHSEIRLPFSAHLPGLAAKSFGIYLIHPLAMGYFSRGLYHLAPWILGQQWLFQPLVITVGLAVPLLLMALVNRSPMRGLYTYLFS